MPFFQKERSVPYMPRGLFQDCVNCFQLIEFEKEKSILGGENILQAKTAPKFMGSSINSRVGWPGANKIPNKGGLPIQPTLNRDPHRGFYLNSSVFHNRLKITQVKEGVRRITLNGIQRGGTFHPTHGSSVASWFVC